jgi:5-methylcytosine-specific restriction endonuclease McrA
LTAGGGSPAFKRIERQFNINAQGESIVNVLVLNASYEMLNVTRWQRAVRLVFSGKAEMLEACGEVRIRSARSSMPMPSVIRMNYYVSKPRLMVPFSRSNVFLRDRCECQYCGAAHKTSELTLDHVVPRAAGGETCWENVVTACRRCNTVKGDRTPEQAGMRLSRKPRIPHVAPSLNHSFRAEWEKYVPYAAPEPAQVS